MSTSTRKAARLNFRAIVDGLNLQAAMIAPHYTGLAAALQELADADYSLEEAAWEIRRNEIAQAYGFQGADSDKPFIFSEGVAIIPVHGVLINRFQYSWGIVTGYNFIREQHKAALADSDVKLIIHDHNSFGGMVAGCFETVDLIYSNRSVKPTIAVVDANSYSASYALSSAANKLVVVPSAGVGSIGVMAMHINFGKMLKDIGIEVSLIYAGKHKVDGNPFESLPPDVRKNIQSSIDKSYAVFVNSVARNRNLSADAVKATEAQTYDADDALSLGLIDAVQTPSEAVAAYLDELSGSDNQQEFEMSKAITQPGADTQEQPVDQAAIAASARKAERERMSAIINCEEAKDKPKLALHLAMKTEMSVDEAKAVLTAAAPEKQEAATPVQYDLLDAAMAATGSPNVGAGDGSTKDEDPNKSAVIRILSAQRDATGFDPFKQ
jgi:signal peptide peptidase SppA